MCPWRHRKRTASRTAEDISYCSDGGEFLYLNLLRFGSEQVDTLASECLQPTDVDVLLLSSG
jgi:hypothetical protein